MIIFEWRLRLFAGYVVIRPGRDVLMYSTVVHVGDRLDVRWRIRFRYRLYSYWMVNYFED